MKQSSVYSRMTPNKGRQSSVSSGQIFGASGYKARYGLPPLHGLALTHTPPSQISSVAQFRTVDYGYENCSVTFSLEPTTADRNTGISITASPVPVDVWFHLDVPQISAGTLSYNMLYGRLREVRELHDTVRLMLGKEIQGKWFPCPTGTFVTIEVSCADKFSPCDVEFWNNPKYPKFGKPSSITFAVK